MRLRPLTDTRPKCLVPLGGRALLDWQLGALRDAAIHEVAIVVGYRGAQVRRSGVVTFLNSAFAVSNMVASLWRARDWLRDAPCIVSYGDIVYHPSIVRALAATSHAIAIAYDAAWRALWEARFDRPEDDAESLRVAGGRVAAIGDPIDDLEMVDGQYFGLLRFTPSGWRRVERCLVTLGRDAIQRLEMTELLAHLVRAGTEVGAVPISGRWCEVDSLRDLTVYAAKLRGRAGWSHDWRVTRGDT
jgi:choline kinase